MSKDYVEQRDDGYWIAGKRISLASVVYEFQRGVAPESILRSFPLLTLEEIYGAITFYLGNKEEVEKDIADRECEEDEFTKTHPTPSETKEKFQRMRQQMLVRRS